MRDFQKVVIREEGRDSAMSRDFISEAYFNYTFYKPSIYC